MQELHSCSFSPLWVGETEVAHSASIQAKGMHVLAWFLSLVNIICLQKGCQTAHERRPALVSVRVNSIVLLRWCNCALLVDVTGEV